MTNSQQADEQCKTSKRNRNEITDERKNKRKHRARPCRLSQQTGVQYLIITATQNNDSNSIKKIDKNWKKYLFRSSDRDSTNNNRWRPPPLERTSGWWLQHKGLSIFESLFRDLKVPFVYSKRERAKIYSLSFLLPRTGKQNLVSLKDLPT